MCAPRTASSAMKKPMQMTSCVKQNSVSQAPAGHQLKSCEEQLVFACAVRLPSSGERWTSQHLSGVCHDAGAHAA